MLTAILRVTGCSGLGICVGLAMLLVVSPAGAQTRRVPVPVAVAADGTTALHQAVDAGDTDAIEKLLARGADPNARNRYGVTPLWLAATGGNAAIVERLLRAGGDAGTTNAENGETLLMMAARAGNVDAVTQLLEHGADVNATEQLRQQTALMWAGAQRHPAVVRALLARGAMVNGRSAGGLTPLMFAIRSGDIESTQQLLDAGADVKETAPDGTTPLVLAILNARYELANVLLERGADPNAVDPNGSALLALTWVRGAKGYAGAVPPRVATGELDSIGLARSLLAHGADINARIEWKDTPPPSILGSTAGSGITYPKNVAITSFNFVSFVGATPFCLAAFNMDPVFMRFLAEQGADPRIPTRQMITPLLAAAGVGYRQAAPNNDADVMEAVQIAFDLGNDPKAVVDFTPYDFGDWRWNRANALHGAAARGNQALIRWLVEKGLSLEQRTEGGWLPVDTADGIWMTGFTQHQFAAARLIRQLMTELGLTPPAPRSPGQIENDGRNRQATRLDR